MFDKGIDLVAQEKRDWRIARRRQQAPDFLARCSSLDHFWRDLACREQPSPSDDTGQAEMFQIGGIIARDARPQHLLLPCPSRPPQPPPMFNHLEQGLAA